MCIIEKSNGQPSARTCFLFMRSSLVEPPNSPTLGIYSKALRLQIHLTLLLSIAYVAEKH